MSVNFNSNSKTTSNSQLNVTQGFTGQESTDEEISTIWERISCSWMNIKDSLAHFKSDCSHVYSILASAASSVKNSIKGIFTNNEENNEDEIDRIGARFIAQSDNENPEHELAAREASMQAEIDKYNAKQHPHAQDEQSLKNEEIIDLDLEQEISEKPQTINDLNNDKPLRLDDVAEIDGNGEIVIEEMLNNKGSELENEENNAEDPELATILKQALKDFDAIDTALSKPFAS
jgi:hypothetical protein